MPCIEIVDAGCYEIPCCHCENKCILIVTIKEIFIKHKHTPCEDFKKLSSIYDSIPYMRGSDDPFVQQIADRLTELKKGLN